MYFVDRCVVCDSGSLARWPAVTSPFVAEIARLPAPIRCALAECAGCGHRFFDLRLDEAEIARLYAHYRGDAYFALRHRWEPWYTRAANDAIGHDPAEIAGRRAYVLDFLRRSLPGGVSSVLDYGGDEGQFIPPELSREKFVYEVSDVRPVAGVTRLDALDRGFDLVMVCHVLEHTSDPLKFLRELRGKVRAGWMYAEVPLERPRVFKLHANGGRGEQATWIRRARPLWLGLDFYSTLFRVKLGVVPPLGPIKLHEHLNFFSANSLRTLFERAGYSVTACEEGNSVVKLLARFSAGT